MDEKPDTDGAGASGASAAAAAAVQMMTERPANELVGPDQDLEYDLAIVSLA